jgi:hypothetical protein
MLKTRAKARAHSTSGVPTLKRRRHSQGLSPTPQRGIPSAAVSEKQVVTTPEPGTRALVLPGIVFLTVVA